MKDKEIQNKLQTLLLDKDFAAAKKLAQQPNILQVVGVNEVSYSKIIAWLLDMNEGHQLGVKFFNELLKAAYIEYKQKENKSFVSEESSYTKNYFFHDEYWNSDFSFDNFTPSIVQVELGLDQYGRMDIVVTDIANSLVVVIENKYQANQTSNQLSRYTQYVSNNEEYNVVQICLDFSSKWDGCDSAHEWVLLDYDFIAEFVAENIPSCNELYRKALNDIYNLITDEYEIYEGLNLEKHDEATTRLYHNHKEVITKVIQAGRTPFNPFIAAESEELELLHVYQVHRSVFEELSAYRDEDIIKAWVNAKYPGQFDYDTDEGRRTYFYCYKKEWGFSGDDAFIWIDIRSGTSKTLRASYCPDLAKGRYEKLPEKPKCFEPDNSDNFRTKQFEFNINDNHSFYSAFSHALEMADELYKTINRINHE